MTPQPIISKMAFKGHPIHPMLVHFPVAALIGLIGTDLGFILTGDIFWARAGLWLAGIGTAGGALASLAGLVDIVAVREIRRLISAWCHAVFAVMLLSLAAFNWMLRLDDAAALIVPWGLYVSLLSGALIGITAYLGGRLVYEHAVGVDIDYE